MVHRELWVEASGKTAAYVREHLDFAGARQVAMLRKTSTEIATGESGVETWYLVTSAPPGRADARWLLKTIRGHWGIENKVHHVKDRTWREDAQKTRKPKLGAVLALLRVVVLNGLRVGPGFRRGASLAEKSRQCLLQPMRAMRLTGSKR